MLTKINPRFLALFLVIFCLVAGQAQPAYGANWLKLKITKLRASCAEALEPYFHKTVADFANSDVKVPIYGASEDAEPTVIETGKRLGRGFFGGVYIILKMNSDRLAAGYKGTVTIKIGHAVKWIRKLSYFFTKNANLKELSNYEFLHSHREQVSGDEKFPKEAAFANAVFPVVKILSAVYTEYGLSLIKPLVKGKFLKDLAKIIEANGGELPKEMEDGLRDIYNFVQVLHAQVKKDGNGYSADIRPPNLVWIESPEMLELFGYSKPGFALFELDVVPGGGKDFIEGNMTFEMYKEQFIRYAKNAG